MIIKKANVDVGLLLLRIAVGVTFIAHGWSKFMNIEGTTAFFAGLGLASLFVYFVAAVELVGGLAVLFGLFTDVAGILLAINMVFAIILVKFSKGLLGGYEFDLVLLLAALGIAFAGPGKYVLKWGARASERISLGQ
ncbi:MAG: DoxX family protein [Candidatus Jorgensenbacteria bacterium]|nr:DoxX family protein [Candidatus Jorgensenbacteria bacterium]